MRLATRISLGLLISMMSGPFLLHFHTMPIVGFWSEWWAGALGLAAATTGLISRRERSLVLPAALAVPAGLVVVVVLQFALGRLIFPQVGLLYAVYLLWAGLLMILGRYLADTIGLARLADVLAGAVVFGAILGAAAALAQWMGLADQTPWIFANPSASVYGNLGQTNHHTHYSWLGIVSAFYLCVRGYLTRPLLWITIVPIAFGSVLSGSRSVFIYPLVLLLAMAWMTRRSSNSPGPRLLADAVLLVPVVIALSFLGTWAATWIPELSAKMDLSLSVGSGTTVAGSRLYELVSGPSTRLEIARSAWVAFLEHPWLGQGVGNYIWSSFVAASSHDGEAPFMVAEHAHNLFLQLMAESGAPATVAVILLLAFWVRQFFQQTWRHEHFWVAAVLGVGLVHSLLEYPLWYSYFLGPIALLVGAADGRQAFKLAGRRATLYLLAAVLGGGFILASLRADYSQLELASNHPLAAHPDRERAWRISMDSLVKLHKESLLSPWVLMAFINLAEPSEQLAQYRAELCVRGIRFSPARSLVTRCAMQLAIAARDREAQELAMMVLRAYPTQRDLTVGEFAKAAERYPKVAPLLKLGLGK